MSMRFTRLLSTLACALAAMLGSSIAHGDAPCDAGIRDSTSAERTTMTAVLEAAKKALPPAPAGWQIVGDGYISVPNMICKDVERFPWRYQFDRGYQHVDDYETRNRPIDEAGAYAAAEYQKKQPRLDALMAKLEKLSQQQVALFEKGDIAGAQKLNAEMEKVGAELGKVADEGDSEERGDAAWKVAHTDVEMSISVRVNETWESQDAGARNIALPPGAVAALRWDQVGDPAKPDQGHALILFGKWTRTENARWWPTQRPNARPTAAHVISVKVNADPKRIDSVLQRIDFKSLSAVLAK